MSSLIPRILLLDDEPFQLTLLARQLAGLGIQQIETCASGLEALGLLDRQESGDDMIFLDLNMPDMDGVEFVRRLVARHYAGALVLVSGEGERVLETATKLARAHRLNVLGQARKPVSLETLETLLQRWRAHVPAKSTQPRKAYSADEIRRAVNGGELVNYYQPKVEVMSGAVRGVECLVRWRHPVDGLVFPDQFIAAAEKAGIIDDLTRVVLAEALAQARRWSDDGRELRVAVNVSMDNLSALDFPDFVMDELARFGVAANALVLEVTESRLMRETAAPLDILTRLRLKHISLSIDDFGTGHSSLAQLRDIPFDELKIDRSFIHGACDNNTQRSIVTASLGMARELGMTTVAEGVEDREDWDFLRHTGCDLAQGYFIGKPMPAGHLPDWLAGWEGRRQELTPA